jgi:selenocysteine lyase/cysteine desulfurase
MKKELINKNRRRHNKNEDQENAAAVRRREQHRLLDASQVVGIVRAGLAVALKQSLGAKFIMEREAELRRIATNKLESFKDIMGG